MRSFYKSRSSTKFQGLAATHANQTGKKTNHAAAIYVCVYLHTYMWELAHGFHRGSRNRQVAAQALRLVPILGPTEKTILHVMVF